MFTQRGADRTDGGFVFLMQTADDLVS